MKHISIYWKKNSIDLVRMVQHLGVGQVCGNDGHELAVTESELCQVQEYIENHPGQFDLEIHPTTPDHIGCLVESWERVT